MKRTITSIKILLFLFLIATASKANIINVPSNYPTIQSAINASANSDTIVVAPGTYFENINFRGKNIVLTSIYYLNGDTNYVYNTIINGSQPVYPDTASCVIINSGEDSTTVLQGFTITGGHGTKWTDEHGAGVYREGGGIIVQYSSPVIQHNLIVNNYGINSTGIDGAGGGGIRVGDGYPRILNNTFCYNQGKYGEAIVLNYTGGEVKNNLICYNSGGSTFGSGAIWTNATAVNEKIIENNTIAKNVSVNSSSGFYSLSSTSPQTLINNIFYDNHTASTAIQILLGGGTTQTTVSYCNVQNGYPGNGNINAMPDFADTNYFYLNPFSPCVDAGDSSLIYYDPSIGGSAALFPSMGLLRNDMGAYGGPGAGWLPSCNPILLGVNDFDLKIMNVTISPNPFKTATTISLNLKQQQHIQLSITDMNGKNVLNLKNENISAGEHTFTLEKNSLKPGVYFCILKSEGNSWSEKMIVE